MKSKVKFGEKRKPVDSAKLENIDERYCFQSSSLAQTIDRRALCSGLRLGLPCLPWTPGGILLSDRQACTSCVGRQIHRSRTPSCELLFFRIDNHRRGTLGHKQPSKNNKSNAMRDNRK